MTDQNEQEFSFEDDGFSEKEFLIEEATEPGAPQADREGDGAGEFEVEIDEEQIEEAPRRNPITRILLLVLLLVAAAGGYFYLTPTDEPPQQAQMQIQKQPITMPIKQPVQAAPVAVPEMTGQPKPAPVPPEPTEPVAPAPSPAEVKPAVADKPADPVVAKVAPVAPVSSRPAAAAVAPGGGFSVLAGAFLQQKNLMNAELKVARTGYPFQVEEARKLAAMTRLRYGVFTPGEADAKLADLKRFAPLAFKVKEGDQVAVYAGSYASLDIARRFADRLYEKGLVLEEVVADVPLPLYKLKIGPFADRAAADKAAREASAAGLPVLVVKMPATSH
jgi:cell division septation protein DedD